MSPDKPTRDSAGDADHPHEMYGARAGKPPPAGASGGEAREERGSAADSRRHPPHPSESSEAGDVQSEEAAPNQVPVLPANAQGTDKVSGEDQDQPIDETSMYDGRRDEDKDRPPSTR